MRNISDYVSVTIGLSQKLILDLTLRAKHFTTLLFLISPDSNLESELTIRGNGTQNSSESPISHVDALCSSTTAAVTVPEPEQARYYFSLDTCRTDLYRSATFTHVT
jgi:hypothetical protein